MEHEVSTHPNQRITPEEYLEIERRAETRSEYVDGEMFAMAGTTIEHTRIVRNIITELTLQLRDRPCEVLSTDLRTKVARTGLYTYPDIVGICGSPLLEDDHRDTLLNPVLVIEFLSESTESYDRGKKFAHYRSLASLREYVLVSHYEYRIEKFSVSENGVWVYTECADIAGAIELASISCQLPLSRAYDEVDFEAAKRRLLARSKES
jgi:Uma2 family endonuclease